LFDELGFSRSQLLLQEATVHDFREAAVDRAAVR